MIDYIRRFTSFRRREYSLMDSDGSPFWVPFGCQRGFFFVSCNFSIMDVSTGPWPFLGKNDEFSGLGFGLRRTPNRAFSFTATS